MCTSYKGKVNLATIIYLHRITDNRMSSSLWRNLRMFISLCGQTAMPNVIVATTMWGRMKEDDGTRREEELKRTCWAEMMAGGCRVERFRDSCESAWLIIDRLAETDRAKVQVSHEIVDRQLQLKRTTAGVTLNQELKQLLKSRKETVRKLQAEAKSQGDKLVLQDLNQQQAEIDKKIIQTTNDLKELKVPFTTQSSTIQWGAGY